MEMTCTIVVLIICFSSQLQNEKSNLCVYAHARFSSQPNLPGVLSETEEKEL